MFFEERKEEYHSQSPFRSVKVEDSGIYVDKNCESFIAFVNKNKPIVQLKAVVFWQALVVNDSDAIKLYISIA